MLRYRLSLVPFLLAFSGCAVASHRAPSYGPSPTGLAADNRKALDDQISSVDSSLSGLDLQISSLNGQIAGYELSNVPGREGLLNRARAEKDRLQMRKNELQSRRNSLQILRNSMQGRDTVPAR